MPRPRKVTDDALFDATRAVMSHVGPNELTLEAIAREAGVTPAVLVQRFGSKRQLLLAFAARVADAAGTEARTLRDRHASPLAALYAYAECMSELAASPAAFARSLAYLQIDLADPDFRRLLLKQAQASRAALERLIRAAQRAGQLTNVRSSRELGRLLEATIAGSLFAWACYRQGTAARWIRRDVQALLRPYLRRRRRRRPGLPDA